jgi:DNA-binding XRE family transcriptional regulator
MSSWKAYNEEHALLLRQFGEHARGIREGRTPLYSQEALSHDARLHRTEIGKIERGETEPGLLTVLILAEGLGVTLNDLVEGLPVPKERRPPPGAPTD